MYFEISHDIRRETDFDVADIRKIDEYLARPNRKTFDLWSVQSHTGLGDLAGPLLGEYIKRHVVSKPKLAYLCPVHETVLKPVKWRKARCIDCSTSYSRSNCKTEVLYTRIMPPDRMPTPAGTTQIVYSATTRQPTIRQRLSESLSEHTVFIIRGVIVGVIVALCAAWLIPRVFPPASIVRTAAAPVSTQSPTISNRPTNAITLSANGHHLRNSSARLSTLTPRVAAAVSHTPSPRS